MAQVAQAGDAAQAAAAEEAARLAPFTHEAAVELFLTLQPARQRQLLQRFVAHFPEGVDRLRDEVAIAHAAQEAAAPDLAAAIAAQAEAALQRAMESIRIADEALGGGDQPECEQAILRLQAETTPLAKGAADAQKLIHLLLSRAPSLTVNIVKRAELYVRQVVVLRCEARCLNPTDRDEFVAQIDSAYDNEVDTEVRSQLLQAYHKNHEDNGFVSNNRVAANRRGGARKRRKKEDQVEADVVDPTASSSAAGNSAAGGMLNGAPSSSSCGADAEPMYVSLAPNGYLADQQQASCTAASSQPQQPASQPLAMYVQPESMAPYPAYQLQASCAAASLNGYSAGKWAARHALDGPAGLYPEYDYIPDGYISDDCDPGFSYYSHDGYIPGEYIPDDYNAGCVYTPGNHDPHCLQDDHSRQAAHGDPPHHAPGKGRGPKGRGKQGRRQ